MRTEKMNQKWKIANATLRDSKITVPLAKAQFSAQLAQRSPKRAKRQIISLRKTHLSSQSIRFYQILGSLNVTPKLM